MDWFAANLLFALVAMENKPTFVLYSKPGCPYCVRVRELLSEKGFEYSEHMLGSDFERPEFYAKFGEGSTFPRVIMNGDLIGGCDDTLAYFAQKGW